MPLHYEIDAEHDLAVLRASGLLTVNDIESVVDKSMSDAGAGAALRDTLIILDPAASLNEIDLNAILRVKAHVETWLAKFPRRPIKCAIVTEPIQKLVVELWSARTNFDPAMTTTTRGFLTETEALDWLRPGASTA